MTRRNHQQSLAAAFHALGDATRLELLRRLKDREMCVCDLVGALQLGQSLVSFHLKVLRDAGLIAQRRTGRWAYYSLVPAAFTALREQLASNTLPAATNPSHHSDDSGTHCACHPVSLLHG